jgi:hypothetical protein
VDGSIRRGFPANAPRPYGFNGLAGFGSRVLRLVQGLGAAFSPDASAAPIEIVLTCRSDAEVI